MKHMRFGYTFWSWIDRNAYIHTHTHDTHTDTSRNAMKNTQIEHSFGKLQFFNGMFLSVFVLFKTDYSLEREKVVKPN